MKVFELERQIRLYLSIASSNTRKIKRLKNDLAFLEERGLIRLQGKYTFLQRYGEAQRVNCSYRTLQCLFDEPYEDTEGLCLVAYTAYNTMVRGVVRGLTADSTARTLKMGRKRLRKNVARLLAAEVLTKDKNEVTKVKLYRRKKPLPLQQECGNHQNNGRELRNLLQKNHSRDFEYGRDEDDVTMDNAESDYWYWLLRQSGGGNGPP